MTLETLLTDPQLQSSLLPLLAALGLAGALRLGCASGVRSGAAVALAFLLAYAAIIGLPPFPPAASSQKLFYLVALGLLLGVALDQIGAPRRLLLPIAVALPPLALAWLGWARLKGLDPLLLASAALLLAAAWIVLWRLQRAANRDTPGLAPMVMILLANGAVGTVALIGSTASVAQLGFAAAAACGGYMLWNWPRPRWPFGAALLFGAGLIPLLLAAQLVLYSRAPVIALLPLVLIFFADTVAARLPLGDGATARAVRPVVVGLVCLVPAVATWFWASALAGAPDPYAS